MTLLAILVVIALSFIGGYMLSKNMNSKEDNSINESNVDGIIRIVEKSVALCKSIEKRIELHNLFTSVVAATNQELLKKVPPGTVHEDVIKSMQEGLESAKLNENHSNIKEIYASLEILIAKLKKEKNS